MGWRLFFTLQQLPIPRSVNGLGAELEDLDRLPHTGTTPDGTPYLIDPSGRYDVRLNDFFTTELINAPPTTQAAYAYDLKRFLKFLWDNRSQRSWTDATPGDRAAYKHWRLLDPAGARVEATTWDREVATVNQFYRWAVARGHAACNPFVQRLSRSRDPRRPRGQTPAESSHRGRANDIAWLPPATYRRWRDIGVRGFDMAGLPDPAFRGRFASRNGAYCDLMVRTGLRLSEQTSLSVFEFPHPVAGTLNVRSWLPRSIAKGGSARHIYFPMSTLTEVWNYIAIERAEAIEMAQANGAYEQIRSPLIVADRLRPFVQIGGERVDAAKLTHDERRRTFIECREGLEPIALWINEDGLPSKPSAWQEVFKTANRRCVRREVPIRCHPHMLRHSFAVITLEQLWRGHIQELTPMSGPQRETYQRVFGDPLNWIRIRLGHRSIETTQIYLHTLSELEMETRMALVPDGWEPTVVEKRVDPDLSGTDNYVA